MEKQEQSADQSDLKHKMCVCVCVSETDISQPFDAGSPHLPWDHPFYDIARHQIIEVAGQFSDHKPLLGSSHYTMTLSCVFVFDQLVLLLLLKESVQM